MPDSSDAATPDRGREEQGAEGTPPTTRRGARAPVDVERLADVVLRLMREQLDVEKERWGRGAWEEW